MDVEFSEFRGVGFDVGTGKVREELDPQRSCVIELLIKLIGTKIRVLNGHQIRGLSQDELIKIWTFKNHNQGNDTCHGETRFKIMRLRLVTVRLESNS